MESLGVALGERSYPIHIGAGILGDASLYAPCAGRVLRVPRSGNQAKLDVVATGLFFPSAMTMGPDGNLYVSNFGYGFPAGAGEVVRVDLH